MNSNTKFFRLISELVIQSREKLWVFQNIVTVSIFTLFLGFVCGNLFGTFLNYFRNFVSWDGIIISLTILVIEFINYLNFHINKSASNTSINEKKLTEATSNRVSPSLQAIQNQSNEQIKNLRSYSTSTLNFKSRSVIKFPALNKRHWVKILNFYKIGLLLGFFIDAFKVGS